MNNPPDAPFLNLDYIFYQVLVFFRKLANLEFGGMYFVSVLKITLSLLAVFSIVVIVYSIIRILEIKKSEREKYAFATISVGVENGENHKKWQSIVEKANSENPSDLKLAIIEADAILDDMVKKMGYSGDDLGERLKNIELSDFNTLPQAWEAHKVRNKIAHEGNFILTQREAKRIVGLYRKVFEEFEYI